MLVRFATAELHGESHQELGVFQAGYRLRDRGLLSQSEESLLQEISDWFNVHLEKAVVVQFGLRDRPVKREILHSA